jgi:hypothetical protein
MNVVIAGVVEEGGREARTQRRVECATGLPPAQLPVAEAVEHDQHDIARGRDLGGHEVPREFVVAPSAECRHDGRHQVDDAAAVVIRPHCSFDLPPPGDVSIGA